MPQLPMPWWRFIRLLTPDRDRLPAVTGQRPWDVLGWAARRRTRGLWESGRGSLAAGQVTLGDELGGEGRVTGQAEDLELAVGPLARLHHAAAIAVELPGSHDPDYWGAVA